MDTGLRTSWSQPQTFQPGEYEAVFREDVLWMAAGRYTLVVGLSSFERPFHYAQAGFLEIAEYADADGVNPLRVSNSGVLLNPLEIEITQSQ
jgi:hypothetical protein